MKTKTKKKKPNSLIKERKKVEEFIFAKITEDSFVDYLINIGELTNEVKNLQHGEIIKGKCRYFATWFVAAMAGKDKDLQKEFKIHEGTVNGKHHVWVEYKDFFIDGTITQFYPNKDKIHLTRKDSSKGIYRSLGSYSLLEWFHKEEKSLF